MFPENIEKRTPAHVIHHLYVGMKDAFLGVYSENIEKRIPAHVMHHLYVGMCCDRRSVPRGMKSTLFAVTAASREIS